MVGMSAFYPTMTAKLHRAASGYSVSGARVFAAPILVGISVVTMRSATDQTSVRADKSGTKSYADETIKAGRLLVHPRVAPADDDLIEVGGVTYRIDGVRPVFDMRGQLDHYQVELDSWV